MKPLPEPMSLEYEYMLEAAPDMLAVLELLLHGDGRPNETLRIMAQARIAVAKARHA